MADPPTRRFSSPPLCPGCVPLCASAGADGGAASCVGSLSLSSIVAAGRPEHAGPSLPAVYRDLPQSQPVGI